MSIVGYLHIEFETVQSVTIADPERAGVLHRPMVLNNRGEVEVPPTGLVGALRDHLESPKTHLGAERPKNDQDPIAPSRLRALGTELTRGAKPVLEADLRIRSQTAIDRTRAGAASKMLRISQELPPGAAVALYCEYDGEVPNGLVDELLTWQPVIGGGRTQGQGAARVVAVSTGQLDLDDAGDLAVFLSDGGPGLVRRVAGDRREAPVLSDREPFLRFEATIEDGLFTSGGVRSETDAGANRQLGLKDHEGKWVIEGSSLKGVLRSRIASIASSILALQGHADPVTGGSAVADQIFGTTKKRGFLSVASSAIATTAEPAIRPHVGIDRFTGGAAPGLLFEEEVITEGSFELRIDLLGDEAPLFTMPLLLAACADIHAGYCGIGGKNGRGYGTVSLRPTDVLAGALPLDPTVVDLVTEAAEAVDQAEGAVA